MKILAIWRVKPDVDMTEVLKHLVDEERFAWGSFLDGTLREHYASDMPTPAISILEANSVAHAQARFADLPLLKLGFITGEFFELRPFKNWDVLFRPEEVIDAPSV